MNVISKARNFAIRAHDSIGQLRKYTHEPYWRHPEAVAELVSSVTDDESMIAAAWLHDVVEDTPVTIGEIYKVFGPDIGYLVGALTDVAVPSDGNRATRKNIEKMRLSKVSPEAQTIKLADLIDNTKSIVEHDQKFAEVYLEEKTKLIAVLLSGNTELYAKATDNLIRLIK